MSVVDGTSFGIFLDAACQELLLPDRNHTRCDLLTSGDIWGLGACHGRGLGWVTGRGGPLHRGSRTKVKSMKKL